MKSDYKPPCPLLGFAEITQATQGEGSVKRGPTLVMGVLSKEAEDTYEVMGSLIMVAQLIQHPTSEEMYINMLTCTLSIVGLRLDPLVDDHPALALQELHC